MGLPAEILTEYATLNRPHCQKPAARFAVGFGLLAGGGCWIPASDNGAPQAANLGATVNRMQQYRRLAFDVVWLVRAAFASHGKPLLRRMRDMLPVRYVAGERMADFQREPHEVNLARYP